MGTLPSDCAPVGSGVAELNVLESSRFHQSTDLFTGESVLEPRPEAIERVIAHDVEARAPIGAEGPDAYEARGRAEPFEKSS